jgi:lipoprotein NlpI
LPGCIFDSAERHLDAKLASFLFTIVNKIVNDKAAVLRYLDFRIILERDTSFAVRSRNGIFHLNATLQYAGNQVSITLYFCWACLLCDLTNFTLTGGWT